MGKAARLAAREKRRANEAEFGVFCPGMLEVLSIGKGDLKLVVDGSNAEDREKAKNLIEEMLRKGYGIYVETDDGPQRVRQFHPNRMTYEIVEEPARALGAGGPAPAALPPGPPVKRAAAKRAGKRAGTREVPVAGSRSTAVGRTSGG